MQSLEPILQNVPRDVAGIIVDLSPLQAALNLKITCKLFNNLDWAKIYATRYLQFSSEDYTFLRKKFTGKQDPLQYQHLNAHKEAPYFPLLFRAWCTAHYAIYKAPFGKDIMASVLNFETFVYGCCATLDCKRKFIFLTVETRELDRLWRDVEKAAYARADEWQQKLELPNSHWKWNPINAEKVFQSFWHQTQNPLFGVYLGIIKIFGFNKKIYAQEGVDLMRTLLPYPLAQFTLGFVEKIKNQRPTKKSRKV